MRKNSHEIKVNKHSIQDLESNAMHQAESIDANSGRLEDHEKMLAKHHKSIYGTMNGFTDKVDSQQHELALSNNQLNANSANIEHSALGIKKNNDDIADLRKDFEKMSKEYSSGIAGVGHLSGESAIAVGIGYRLTDSVTTQLGLSANSGNNVKPVIGAGISMSM